MTSLDAQPTHLLRYHWLAPGRGAVTTLAPLLWAKFYSASLALSFATHWHVPGLVDQFGRATNTLGAGAKPELDARGSIFPRLGVFARASFRGLSGTGTFQVLMTSLDAQPTHLLRYHWLAPGRGAVTTLAPLLWAKFYSASLALSFATHWHVPGLVDQFGRATNTLAPLPRTRGRSWRGALGRSRSWALEAAYFRGLEYLRGLPSVV